MLLLQTTCRCQLQRRQQRIWMSALQIYATTMIGSTVRGEERERRGEEERERRREEEEEERGGRGAFGRPLSQPLNLQRLRLPEAADCMALVAQFLVPAWTLLAATSTRAITTYIGKAENC